MKRLKNRFLDTLLSIGLGLIIPVVVTIIIMIIMYIPLKIAFILCGIGITAIVIGLLWDMGEEMRGFGGNDD